MTRSLLVFLAAFVAATFAGAALVPSPRAGAAPAQEDPPVETTTTTSEATTTTTELVTTTTTPATTTTTDPAFANAECFTAGQSGEEPPSPDPSCGVAWSSGRQTNAFLQDEAERDDWFRKPALVGLILVVLFGSARVVSGWRR